MKMFEDPPEVISHDAHPAHKLKLVTAATTSPPFRCDGCKEPGSGKGRRYRCGVDGCEFDLHTCCSLAEPTVKHPLLANLEFKLLPEAPPPPGAAAAAVCSACGDEAHGLVYSRSSSRKAVLYLHPCCAALKTERVLQDEHHVQLRGEAKLRCVLCSEKGHRPFSGKKLWAYRWRYGGAEGYLHVACVKRVAVQRWEEAYLQDGSGVLEASVPIMKGALQRRSPGDNNETVKTSGLELAVGGIEVAGSIFDVVSAATSSS